MEIKGRLAPFIAAVEAAEEGRRFAHKEVRDSVLELGALMDERTRLLALGASPASARLELLMEEELRVRAELSFARELLLDVEQHLARKRQALRVALGR